MEFLGCPSWRKERLKRGEFRLFEAEGRVSKFERLSLSTGQKLHAESEGVILQQYLIVNSDFDFTVISSGLILQYYFLVDIFIDNIQCQEIIG